MFSITKLFFLFAILIAFASAQRKERAGVKIKPRDFLAVATDIVANGNNAPARRSLLNKLCSTFAKTIEDDVKYIWRSYPLGIGRDEEGGTIGADGCILFCVAADMCFRSAATIVGLPCMTCHGIYKALKAGTS